ncbi:hypothetical protein BRC65_07360 [Halobacteriales archaeon QH_2_65_14]|nr:MAG: hypothetical protein BRC65_07360 [Halobacteriales archaeon QH_2_65_14]
MYPSVLRTGSTQRRVTAAALDSMDSQESIQRRSLELQQAAVHDALDAFEANVPGTETATDDIREAFDEQVEVLFENHEAFFANVSSEFEVSADVYDEMTDEYLDALDEQVDMLLDAHEDVEAQSTEAIEA